MALLPVEVDVLTLGHLGNARIVADRAPDLCLELSGRNIIAEKLVVYCCQLRLQYFFP